MLYGNRPTWFATNKADFELDLGARVNLWAYELDWVLPGWDGELDLMYLHVGVNLIDTGMLWAISTWFSMPCVGWYCYKLTCHAYTWQW